MFPVLPPFDKDNWELYDGSKDWTQAHDLSKEMPEKLAELQRLWLIEATKYNVLPLDDRTFERFNADLAGRPQLIKGNSQLLFAGMGRLLENCVVNIKNKSWSVTAELVVPAAGAKGVIIHQAGKFGGWSLYTKAGKAKFAYNFLGLKLFTTEASKPIPSGEHQVRMEFKYDGGGLGKGGNVTLYYDGQKAGEGRVEVTQPMAFSGDEGLDIGHETGTNVTPDCPTQESEFTGKIRWVQIGLGTDSHDHLITPEQRLHIAMTRQ
jgi:arylsulfatase